MDGADSPWPLAESLYRRDAVFEARSRLGAPVRPVGVASWTICAFLIALLVATAIFLSTARYSRKETVEGELEPTSGALRITSAKPGTIADVFVREGAEIQAGAPIVSVAFDPTLEGGVPLGRLLNTAIAGENAALVDQARAHQDSLERQRSELDAKRGGLLLAIQRLTQDEELQQERLDLQQKTLEAFGPLHLQQFISEIKYRQQQEEVIGAKQALSAIGRQREEDETALREVKEQDLRLRADLAESKAQARSSGALQQEKEANLLAGSHVVLTAPKAGRVVALQAKAGAAITSSAAVAVIMPAHAALEANLWVPSRAAGFLRPGDPVRIRYDAFPYERFGLAHGRIVSVAKAPILPSELPQPIETHEALYRVVVGIDDQAVSAYGKRWALAPGMRLRADVVLESRTFLQWIFDPLRASVRRAS